MRCFNSIFPLLLLCIVSCDRAAVAPSVSHQGTYLYQAFDSTGTLIVKGWIEIKINESVPPDDENNYFPIDGKWYLDKIGDPENIGMQVGEGSLIGTIEQDDIRVNLNPGWADNNVFLNGKINGNEITGHWYYSTFVGAINGGAFKATKWGF